MGRDGLSLEPPMTEQARSASGLGSVPPTPRKVQQDPRPRQMQDLDRRLIKDEIRPGLSQVQELLQLGTLRMGGAPEDSSEDDHGIWRAKVNRQDDRWNMLALEYAMLASTGTCGITCPKAIEPFGGNGRLA